MECITGWGQERGGHHSTCPLGADSLREKISSARQHENTRYSCPEYVRYVEGRRILSHQVKLPGGRVGGREEGKGTQGERLVQARERKSGEGCF